MDINYAKNINFKAKLDIHLMKYDKPKWKNIAGIFAKETKTYPKDRFGTGGRPDTDFFMGITDRMGLYGWLFCTLSKEASSKFLSLPDSEIAKKLKSVFEFLKYKEKIILDAEASLNNTDKVLWEILHNKLNNKKKLLIDNDSFLRDNLKIW